MIEQLRRLYELQRLDTQLGEHQAYLARLDDGRRLRVSLATLETERTTEQEKLAALERELRDTELALEAAEDERNQLRTKLYSGTIMNPKELADVQMKIESLTTRKGDLEEKALLLMDEVEAQTGVVEELTKQTDDLRERAEAVEQHHREETARVNALMGELAEQRERAVEGLDASLLNKYDRIRRTHDNLGIVRVETDICPGCHTQITTAVLKQLERPEGVILCDSCNRILYAAPPDDVTDAEPTEAEGGTSPAAAVEGEGI